MVIRKMRGIFIPVRKREMEEEEREREKERGREREKKERERERERERKRERGGERGVPRIVRTPIRARQGKSMTNKIL